MSLNIQEMKSAYADRVFDSLQRHLREWFLENAPDWHLHHMGLSQDVDPTTFERRAKVLLHLHPCEPEPELPVRQHLRELPWDHWKPEDKP